MHRWPSQAITSIWIQALSWLNKHLRAEERQTVTCYPPPPPRDRAFTRHTTTTKLTARPKNPIHRAYRERRHFSEQHTSRESIIVIASMFLKRPGSLPFRIHAACWWTVIHLWFAKVLQVYSRAAGWGAFQSKAVLTAHMFTFSAAHIDSSI